MSLLSNMGDDIRVLIVHPDNRSMRRYLSELMRDYDVLYTRFPGINLGFKEVEYRVFGQWNAIGEIETMPDVYILDECDRLSVEAFNELLPSLILCNPISIVIFSRTFPLAVIDESDCENCLRHIQVISDTGLFALNATDRPLMEVTGFGIGRVRVNGQDITFDPGTPIREFFFYLLENSVIYRDEVIAQFWSDCDHRTAVDSFYATLTRLNALFGFRLFYPSGTHYRINPDVVIDYDVKNFRDIFQNLMMGYEDPNPSSCEKAYRLYHHDFLQTTQSEWVASKRDELRNLQSDVCVSRAKVAKTPEIALGLYAMAFHYNPYREDIARAMMTHYLNNDLPCDALKVYRVIEANLMQASGISPGKDLKQLMQQAEERCPHSASIS